MRLLDTTTILLVERTPKELQKGNTPYAILSHVWGKDEVIYRDIVDGKAHLKAEASMFKVYKACEQARCDGYKYIWIDTCCIDKSSSSELSEAINSMYLWYQEARECYAFLDDVPNELDTFSSKHAFRCSRWFTRGWTLQELLAPRKVVFFSKDWQCLGEKRALSPLLAEITAIDETILRCELPVESASVAKRMSWASLRETTRPEDLAYCLMGLFGVNMPMLYGEGGERAFLRLQEEIMKSSDDQSLFAWTDQALGSDPDALHGLLATNPSGFSKSNGMLPYRDWEPREPYMMTNRGLHIQLHLTAIGDDMFVASLDCPVPPDYQDSTFLALYLKKLTSGGENDDQIQHYHRVRVNKLASVRQRGKLKSIYVRQTPQGPINQGVFPWHILQLRNGPPTDLYRLERVIFTEHDSSPNPLSLRQSARNWVPESYSRAFTLRKGAAQLTVALIFTRDDGETIAVLAGSISGFQVGFSAVELVPEDKGRITDLTLQDFVSIAELSASGRVETEFHSVRCSVTTVVQNSHKYYLMDIGIEDIKRSRRIHDILADEATDLLRNTYGMDMVPEPEPTIQDNNQSRRSKGNLFKKMFPKYHD